MALVKSKKPQTKDKTKHHWFIFSLIVIITISVITLVYVKQYRNTKITLVTAAMSMQELEKITKKEPANTEAKKFLALAYYHDFKYDQAIDTENQYLNQNSTDVEQIVTLANIYRDKGEGSGDKNLKKEMLKKS